MNIFFTADCHFNHFNIIKYENRPFSDVNEMNETLIKNWNSVIGKKDRIYILGDFVFGNPIPFVKRLNGYKILIKGNHDRYSNTKAFDAGIKEIYDLKKIKINDQIIILCHYPLYSWEKSNNGSWHLHGHCHAKEIDFNKQRYNVGVDVNDFKPISFEEIEKQIKTNINNINSIDMDYVCDDCASVFIDPIITFMDNIEDPFLNCPECFGNNINQRISRK